MSIITTTKVFGELSKSDIDQNYTISDYQPTEDEKNVRQMIIRHFTLGDVTMQEPRVEFNDMSVLARMQIDQMSFNAYQPNNGAGYEGDEVNGWRSNALRPIVRNKCISIAAHATARTIFPRIFAFDSQSNEQREAAQVMEDLNEWSADQSNYEQVMLYRVVTALTDPASIGYTEYAEVYRSVKRTVDDNGKWVEEKMLDETLSGFQRVVVPVDQLYIENFYEPDIQKQGWLIWRRVQSYQLMEAKYKDAYDNFKYVRPGVQLIYNDANQSFYSVYDNSMRQEDCEEIIYWNKNLDLKIIMVNGVMLTKHDNPNPRNDKLYPFDKFGYEIINNRCFYYKSLAFKMQQDANIINTLYPMIIDGTYLNMMPPMVNVGGETIASDVIVPGGVTTLSSPDADLRAINVASNVRSGFDALAQVEESLNQSSEDPLQSGQPNSGTQTAYEISRLEQNAATVLGLFIKMISDHVKQFGRLNIGDILQYLTIADVDKITDDPELVYKTFLVHNKLSNGKERTRKIKFDPSVSTELQTDEEKLENSYKVLKEQGGEDSNIELYKANPELYRNLKYMVTVSPDILHPRSDDLERAYKLEAYDRAILNPLADQEAITRDLLFGANPMTKKDPDKYMKKQELVTPMSPMDQIQMTMGTQQPGGPGPLESMGAQAKTQVKQGLPTATI